MNIHKGIHKYTLAILESMFGFETFQLSRILQHDTEVLLYENERAKIQATLPISACGVIYPTVKQFYPIFTSSNMWDFSNTHENSYEDCYESLSLRVSRSHGDSFTIINRDRNMAVMNRSGSSVLVKIQSTSEKEQAVIQAEEKAVDKDASLILYKYLVTDLVHSNHRLGCVQVESKMLGYSVGSMSDGCPVLPIKL